MRELRPILSYIGANICFDPGRNIRSRHYLFIRVPGKHVTRRDLPVIISHSRIVAVERSLDRCARPICGRSLLEVSRDNTNVAHLQEGGDRDCAIFVRRFAVLSSLKLACLRTMLSVIKQ